MVTTKLNLSMTEPQVRQIYAKQGDTGRVLDITLDQTPEDGTLRILRPDGVEVTSEAVTGGEVESGSSFESLTEADVTELTVGIEPVQDLNGYDKPWVGGAGKNKFDKDNPNIVNAYITANGLVQSNPDNRMVYVRVTPNSTVSVSFTQVALPTATTRDDVQAGVFSSEPIGGVTGTRKGTWSRPSATENYTYSFSFSVGDNDYVAVKIGNTQRTDVNASLETLQIEYGSSPTAWQPYSNICPITGHDEVRVTRTGINVWDEEWEQGNISDQTGKNIPQSNIIRSKNYIPVKPSTTYYSAMQGGGIFLYGANKQYLGSLYSGFPTNFTTPNNCYFIRFRESGAYGITYKNDISINYPSTDHDYHPHQGSTYTTSLGQTVYGGTLDMVTGQLVVDRGIVDMGSLTWLLNSSLNGKPAFYVRLNDAKTVSASSVADMTTSCYSVISADNLYLQKDNTGIIALNGQNYLQVRDTRYSTASDYKSGITGQQLVYELATPLTYTLTPQQIKTLVGTNNVWASSGQIVNITFTYGGLLSELPSDATSVVGKCYCDIEQNGVSSMPFTLNVKKNERAT